MSAPEQPGRSWDELERNAEREYGEVWTPWKRDDQPRTLIGTIDGYNLAPDFGYGRHWFCNIDDRDGKHWSIPLNVAALAGQFEEKRPMPGERVAVRYRGVSDRAPRVAGHRAPYQFTVTVGRERLLPDFLVRPRLEAGDEPDVPLDTGGLASPDVDVPEAEVVEDPPAAMEGSGPAGGEIQFLWDGPPDWWHPRTQGCGR